MNEEERKKGLNHMREVRKKVIAKWESTGFLDGLDGFSDHKKENIAKLYEGQARQLISENQTGDTKPIDQIYIPLAVHVAKQLSGHTIT